MILHYANPTLSYPIPQSYPTALQVTDLKSPRSIIWSLQWYSSKVGTGFWFSKLLEERFLKLSKRKAGMTFLPFVVPPAELSFLSINLLRLHSISLSVINEGTEEHQSQERALRNPTHHHSPPGHNSGCVHPANSLSTEWLLFHQIHLSSIWWTACHVGLYQRPYRSLNYDICGCFPVDCFSQGVVEIEETIFSKWALRAENFTRILTPSTRTIYG